METTRKIFFFWQAKRRIVTDLAPVVQTMDSAIHWISNSETNCNIQWIVIYPEDSVIHRLNNWGLGSIVRKPINLIQY